MCRVFRLLCVKGAPPKAVRDCFYNPPTAARFPNPSRRRLQVCFAHSQIPCVKGAPPQAVRDCFFTTRLGDACKRASHTRKSLSPLRGPPPLTQGRRIQTRLGDACKRASHTRKSSARTGLTKNKKQRRNFRLCFYLALIFKEDCGRFRARNRFLSSDMRLSRKAGRA